jgi:hypothetical protein
MPSTVATRPHGRFRRLIAQIRAATAEAHRASVPF